jgi:hypothetical protein
MFETKCKVNYVKNKGNCTYGHEGGHCTLYKKHNGDGSIHLDIEMAPGVKVCLKTQKVNDTYWVQDNGFEKILKKEIRRRKEGEMSWYFPDFTLEELQWIYNPLPSETNSSLLSLFQNGYYEGGVLFKIPWEKIPKYFIDNSSDSFFGEKYFCYVWGNSYCRKLSLEDYIQYGIKLY